MKVSARAAPGGGNAQYVGFYLSWFVSFLVSLLLPLGSPEAEQEAVGRLGMPQPGLAA